MPHHIDYKDEKSNFQATDPDASTMISKDTFKPMLATVNPLPTDEHPQRSEATASTMSEQKRLQKNMSNVTKPLIEKNHGTGGNESLNIS